MRRMWAGPLVRWNGDLGLLIGPPLIEALMIDTQSLQGISFAPRGSVIRQMVPADLPDATAAQ